MSRNKLKKFAELSTFPCVYEFSPTHCLGECQQPIRWNAAVFHNTNPIELELGCGYGEYTLALAARFPNRNFIGVDIKGARLWQGAKTVMMNKLSNVAFLRTQIEMLPYFFSPDEIAKIWLPFPDPQMKKMSKRLVSTAFFRIYRHFLKPDGDIYLKTDSLFLYRYTIELLKINNIPILESSLDLDDYHNYSTLQDIIHTSTHYEELWRKRGIPIKFLHWCLPVCEDFVEPEVEIAPDLYKSHG